VDVVPCVAGPDGRVAAAPVAQCDGRRGRRPIRVLLADDHTLFRSGIRSLLESEPGFEVLGEAGDGDEAVELAGLLEPEVLLLDMTMPGMSGLDVTGRIVGRYPHIRVLALSMHSDSQAVQRMLEIGASGYMVKASSPEDLLRGIRVVADDEVFLCSKTATAMVGYTIRDQPKRERRFDRLTAREREVLGFIADGRSSRQIATTLELSVKTVETHRSRLMKKLNLHTVADLTKCAIREGLTTIEG